MFLFPIACFLDHRGGKSNLQTWWCHTSRVCSALCKQHLFHIQSPSVTTVQPSESHHVTMSWVSCHTTLSNESASEWLDWGGAVPMLALCTLRHLGWTISLQIEHSISMKLNLSSSSSSVSSFPASLHTTHTAVWGRTGCMDWEQTIRYVQE